MEVCNRCDWAKNGNFDACTWWDPEEPDLVNRASTALGENSQEELVIDGDNPSRGWAFRKDDLDGYALDKLAADGYFTTIRQRNGGYGASAWKRAAFGDDANSTPHATRIEALAKLVEKVK